METDNSKAVALLVFDGRGGLPGPDELEDPDQYPEHTIIELPFQRDAVRKLVAKRSLKLTGEVVIELEEGFVAAAVVADIASRIGGTDCRFVVTTANPLLEKAGLAAPLVARLRAQKQEIVWA